MANLAHIIFELFELLNGLAFCLAEKKISDDS
jgi:hypothetical protein